MFRCAPHESTLHHDPDCAMSFFVLLLASPFFLNQNCPQDTNRHLCVWSEVLWSPVVSWARNPHSEHRLSSNIHVFQKANVGRCVFDGFCARSTRDSAACNHAFMADWCLASLSAIDSVMLRPCCSSSSVSPSIGAGSKTLLTKSVVSLIQSIDVCCPLHQSHNDTTSTVLLQV